jgi:hypothetical protein
MGRKYQSTYGMKAARVKAILATMPDWDDNQIAEKVGCHLAYVKRLRRKEFAQELRSLEAEGLIVPSTEAQGVDAILEERGSRYGPFVTHAEITQRLKAVATEFIYERDKALAHDQQEALDMIFHKIGRIINGDPDYADSWVDIAGYAKLVADRLEGTVR